MTDKQKIKKLEEAFREVIWMAIRYADGRHTFAPYTVREAIKDFQTVYPEWKPQKDITIKPPNKEDLGGMNFEDDHLYDLFINKNEL